jgi:hypothetical protein
MLLSLPRDLRCWRCGTTRHVEARHGRRIVNKVTVLEWLCGAEAPPGAVEGRSSQHQK